MTNQMPNHSPMNHFKTQGNELLVNGQAISLLKHRAGQTPFYVYDRSVIESKINLLRENLKLNLHYAVKANPMPALVDFISHQVDGLDVASGNELTIALNSGISPEKISFAGPGKQINELTMAVASGVTINVESFNELERIEKISQQLGIQANVALRVNPDFELKSSGMKMSGGAKQFGIDAELIPQAMQKIKDYNLHYRGLHIFTGSQNLNANSLLSAYNEIFQLAEQLQEHAHNPLEMLNIGGGLGIPYFPGDKPLNIELIAEPLNKAIDAFLNQHHSTEIIMELGRFIVAEAGLYVCEVTDIKNSRGTDFAIVNGGLHHQLAASGNFGQVIRKNYPVAIGNKMQEPTSNPVQIVGPLCTPLDLLANQYSLPAIEIGDLVVIYQSGAYGFSASPKDFLSHPLAAEILV